MVLVNRLIRFLEVNYLIKNYNYFQNQNFNNFLDYSNFQLIYKRRR